MSVGLHKGVDMLVSVGLHKGDMLVSVGLHKGDMLSVGST